MKVSWVFMCVHLFRDNSINSSKGNTDMQLRCSIASSKKNMQMLLWAQQLTMFFHYGFRTFNQTVGTFEELQTYLAGYVANLTRADERRQAK